MFSPPDAGSLGGRNPFLTFYPPGQPVLGEAQTFLIANVEKSAVKEGGIPLTACSPAARAEQVLQSRMLYPGYLHIISGK